jgi:hypothetical protein
LEQKIQNGGENQDGRQAYIFNKKIYKFGTKNEKIIRQSLLKFFYSLSSSSLSPLIDGYNSICSNVATFSQLCSQLHNSVQTFPLFLHEQWFVP